jgi:transcriptional regulator with XRE-family HTH domain
MAGDEDLDRLLRSARDTLAASERALADAVAERESRQELVDQAQWMVDRARQLVAAARAEVATLEAGGDRGRFTFGEAIRTQLRLARMHLGKRQEDVAEAMREMGFPWRRLTVTEVESGKRHVSLDELTALAVIFDQSVISFLVPATARIMVLEGPDGEPTRGMDRDTALAFLAGDLNGSVHRWSDEGPHPRTHFDQSES